MTTKKTETPTETPSKKRSPIKIAGLALLGLFGVAHIGVLGHLMNATRRPDFPVINFPGGDYSSYEVEATRDGYKIKYKANDPLVLESERSLKVDKDKRGWLGPTTEKRREYRLDQYTMDGARNLGGADAEGKSLAKSEQCIRADAGARSQGALAGTSIAAGAIAPAVVGIPYIGWLAAGWMTLLGQRVGSDIGSQVGKVFNDC
jgi:hypothetical protein